MNPPRTIGFAGLSHLGIIYSISAAARGFSVLAFDERPELVQNLKAGLFPVVEPGLEDAFREQGKRIRYTSGAEELANCPLIFITLDVPTSETNTSDLVPLRALIGKVGSCAAPGTVLVVMSQVPPGFCRALAATLPPGLRLFYQVETLIFGSAVERAIHPERYMVGCDVPQNELPALYRDYLEAFGCPVLPMRYESAELCKIAINCFLVSSVTTSNTLAEICEKIGADWQEIVPALKLDKRIGPHAYLSPGLGIAGGNLERDLVTARGLASETGCYARVLTAWEQDSAYRQDWTLRCLFRLGLLDQLGGFLFGMWGLAYKPQTHSTKNSPALTLLRTLSAYRWLAYDPAAAVDPSAFPSVTFCAFPLEAARQVDALVVMTPWKEFAAVALESLRQVMRGLHLIDPYGILDGAQCRDLGFSYFRIGA